MTSVATGSPATTAVTFGPSSSLTTNGSLHPTMPRTGFSRVSLANAKSEMDMGTASVQRIIRPLTDLEAVQRKWQMASCAHFLEVFRDFLPLKHISADTAEDLTPLLLEQGIVEPEINMVACIALRNVIMALLVVLEEATLKNVTESWFLSLKMLVENRRAVFLDCFDGTESVLAPFDDGLHFLTAVSWNVRLGLLLSLCDTAAEEAYIIRNAVRDAEQAKPPPPGTLGNGSGVGPSGNGRKGLSSDHRGSLPQSELEVRGIRLVPIGRCSRKRLFYRVGKTRIYSGYKRKGTGGLVVECSDSVSMRRLADALESSKFPKDMQLASEIRSKYLDPLLKLEEQTKRNQERKRLEQAQREETRRRNAHRPRRKKAAYA